MEYDGEMYLVVAPDPQYLRAVRLLAADAGRRAGLSLSEIDDLRIAVDELAQALIEVTEHRLVVRVAVHGNQVVVRGTARRRRNDPVPGLGTVPGLIVDAVTDHHLLEHSASEMWFLLSKRSRAEVIT